MHSMRDIFNGIVQSLANTLLLPDTIEINTPGSTMKNISQGVGHHIGPITTKFLHCYYLFGLTEQNSFGNKAMEVCLINLKIPSFLQPQGKLGETFLRALTDDVG